MNRFKIEIIGKKKIKDEEWARMTDQRRTEINNLLKNTSRKLLRPFEAERHAKLFNDGRTLYFRCIKCRKTKDHRDNMLIIERKGRNHATNEVFKYEVAYCPECAKTYRSHKQRIGGRDG